MQTGSTPQVLPISKAFHRPLVSAKANVACALSAETHAKCAFSVLFERRCYGVREEMMPHRQALYMLCQGESALHALVTSGLSGPQIIGLLQELYRSGPDATYAALLQRDSTSEHNPHLRRVVVMPPSPQSLVKPGPNVGERFAPVLMCPGIVTTTGYRPQTPEPNRPTGLPERDWDWLI